MRIELIIFLVVVWSLIGFFILGFSARFGSCLELERLNPLYIYKDRRVNWFGCFLVTLIFNLISPVATIYFWFSKLCTIGRRYNDDE